VAQLIGDSELNEEQQEYMQIIRSSGKSLLTIINDILDFSKIEAGQLELEERVFDLRQCVADAMDLVRCRPVRRGSN